MLDGLGRRAARRGPLPAARCACWPARAPARRGRSPTASRTWSRTGARRRRAGARGHLHRPGRRRDAHPAARARRRRACRRARSTPRRCASCATSGRGSSAAPPWQVVESKLRIVAVGRAAGRTCGTDAATLRDLAGEIEWAKASLVAPADYPAAVAQAAPRRRRSPSRWPNVYAGYEEAKNARRAARLRRPAAAPRRAPRGARRRRARSSAHRYRCFVVDEYQDVTPLQQRLLDAWLGERDDLTVVGDANQTIYSFAGATPELPARASPGASPSASSCGWSATTARPRRSSGWPTGHRRGPRAAPRAPGCG